MAIKFVHTADTHFGVENYGRIDSKTGLHSRLLDFSNNFSRIVDFCIEKSVDFLVLSGDAYKTPNPTPTQQRLLCQSLVRLDKHKIPAIIIVGNHDNPLSFGKAHALDIFSQFDPIGFHVYDKPGILRLETKNGPVQIVSIPWPTRNNIAAHDQYKFLSPDQISALVSSKVSSWIGQAAAKLDPSIPAALFGHLTLSEGVFSGSEKRAIIGSDPIFLPSALALKPFSYIGLGHLHRHQSWQVGDVTITYAGSIEAIDFGEKNDTKGFCFVQIDTKAGENGRERNCNFEFVKLPMRPMLDLSISVGSGLAQTEQILQFLAQQKLDGAIVKLSYEIAPGTADCVDLNRVEEALSKASHIVKIRPVFANQNRSARFTHIDGYSEAELLSKFFNDQGYASRTQELLLKAEVVKEAVCCDKEKAEEACKLTGGLV